jgi:hypothetical protein
VQEGKQSAREVEKSKEKATRGKRKKSRGEKHTARQGNRARAHTLTHTDCEPKEADFPNTHLIFVVIFIFIVVIVSVRSAPTRVCFLRDGVLETDKVQTDLLVCWQLGVGCDQSLREKTGCETGKHKRKK